MNQEPVLIKGVVAFPNPNGNREIRFIDAFYHDLFKIPDHSNIVISYLDGCKRCVPCEYIDDTHVDIDGTAFHIDRVVNWLREGFAPLKDRNTMRRFCELRGRVLNAEEAILPPCGFSIHTKNYQYMLRCIPRRGDYNFYLYCYDKEAREQERATLQKNTRPIAKKRTEPER